MYTLSDICMLETSHYIQSISDQYIIESYTCESFRDTIHNLIDKIKKMFNKVKEFFKKLFGKNTNNDKKLEEIENSINKNPQLKNEKIQVVDTNKFDKIVDNANKQGKKITAKQIIAAAGITTATIGAVILGIKKFKKNTPNELEKQEKEAIKKAEDIKKEEEKKVVNNTSNVTVNNKNQQKIIELQNELEKINAEIKANENIISSTDINTIYREYVDAEKIRYKEREKHTENFRTLNARLCKRAGGPYDGYDIDNEFMTKSRKNKPDIKFYQRPLTGNFARRVKNKYILYLYEEYYKGDLSFNEFKSKISSYYDNYIKSSAPKNSSYLRTTDKSVEINKKVKELLGISFKTSDIDHFYDDIKWDEENRIYRKMYKYGDRFVNKKHDYENAINLVNNAKNDNEILSNKAKDLENKIKELS